LLPVLFAARRGTALLGSSSLTARVTANVDNAVSRIDKATNTVTATIAVGVHPIGISVDGDSVWVANEGSNTISRISKSTNLVIATIPVGNGVHSDDGE
jgi:YVTN family beta-propeller protein